MGWVDQVERLQQQNYISRDAVSKAMKAVDRSRFVDDQYNAAKDRPIPIESGQTVSAPHMVAIMTELLDPQPDETILEVGTGSGFQAAVLAELGGTIVTVERIAELYRNARDQLGRYNNVIVTHGDGCHGFATEAPYDKMLVTAAADRLYDAWEGQLCVGGRLVVPLAGDDSFYELVVFEKGGGGLERIRTEGRVRFVPLKEGVEE